MRTGVLENGQGIRARAIGGYKCLLRFRIGTDKALTVYPVGLPNVPRDRSDRPANPALHPSLIEPPIRIT